MGCDIHLFVEYASKKREPNHSWRSLSGEFWISRNYLLFGILSKGVRTAPTFSYEPKGLPENLAYEALNESRLYITETGEGDNETTLERALQWEKSGHKITYLKEKPTWVEHPDFHSHSWLTTDELKTAIDFHNSNANWLQPDIEAVFSSMKRLEELGFDARVVFLV